MDMGFFNHRKTQFNSNDTNQGPEDTIRYPPTSTPPTGMTGIKEIREKFNKINITPASTPVRLKNLTKEMHP